MIEITNLKLNTDGDAIVLDANVIDSSYYTDVYISGVKVDTQDTFVDASAPSAQAIEVASYEVSEENKSISLSLDSLDLEGLDLQKNFFIFWIKATGTPSPDVPCGKDNEYTIGVVYNLPAIYARGLNLMKGMGSSCEVSLPVMDFLSAFYAMRFAIKTGNLAEAVSYWKMFYSSVETPVITSGCGCNG